MIICGKHGGKKSEKKKYSPNSFAFTSDLASMVCRLEFGLDWREKEMKPLALVLLAFFISANLMAYASGVPFLGLGIGLLAYPLALKISLRDLFMVNMFHFVAAWALGLNTLLSQFTVGMSFMASLGFSAFLWIYATAFILGLPAIAVMFSVFYALAIKFLSRFTPKRFRCVVHHP